jgi:hypothetical protein
MMLYSGFRKLSWKARIKFVWLALPALPVIAWTLGKALLPALPGIVRPLLKAAFACVRVVPSLIRATLALRSIRLADERRRLERRWKPEGRRKP